MIRRSAGAPEVCASGERRSSGLFLGTFGRRLRLTHG